MKDNAYRQLFEEMNLAAAFIDNGGKIIQANPALGPMFGLNPDQVTGSSITDPGRQWVYEDGSNFPADQHPAILALHDGQSVQNILMGLYNRIRENYTWLLVNAFPLKYDKIPNPGEVLCTFEDVSKLKHSSDNLVQSEERFQRIFNEGPMPMAMLGSDFRFLQANSAFCNMIGYTEKELESLTFKEITHPEHLTRDYDAVKKLLYGVIPNYKTEKRYIRKNKKVIWASLSLLAIHDHNGNFLHFLAMVEPRTESHGFNL
ncbi:MAG: PAS domain S-box protein [Bacteroidota bacterium]